MNEAIPCTFICNRPPSLTTLSLVMFLGGGISPMIYSYFSEYPNTLSYLRNNSTITLYRVFSATFSSLKDDLRNTSVRCTVVSVQR